MVCSFGNRKAARHCRALFGGSPQQVLCAFDIAWPAVMESVFVALAGLIDSLMVSTLGAAAVASVGLTTQPKFIALSLFIALNVSVSALVARRKGQKDRDGANQVLMMALGFTLVMGLVLGAVCIAFAPTFMDLAGSNAETHDNAVLYFRIVVGGMIFSVLSLIINAAQRGSGNTRLSMRANVASSLVNITFNWLLINGHLGFPRSGHEGRSPGHRAGHRGGLLHEHFQHSAGRQLREYSLHAAQKGEPGRGKCAGDGQALRQLLCGADLHAHWLYGHRRDGGRPGHRPHGGPSGGHELSVSVLRLR